MLVLLPGFQIFAGLLSAAAAFITLLPGLQPFAAALAAFAA
jgi:hypothetical protein